MRFLCLLTIGTSCNIGTVSYTHLDVYKRQRVWLTHANALVDSREMVELKHELLTRRQKLRARMEYSVGKMCIRDREKTKRAG